MALWHRLMAGQALFNAATPPRVPLEMRKVRVVVNHNRFDFSFLYLHVIGTIQSSRKLLMPHNIRLFDLQQGFNKSCLAILTASR